MGRPKKQGKGQGPHPAKTIGIKVSGEYGLWLEAMARKYRTTVAGLIDRALAEWAAGQGDDPPPVRVP